MTFNKAIFTTTAFLVATGIAAAQQPLSLDDLDADRLNANQVKIEFDYQGGACEEVGPAELGDLVDGTLTVTFPISATAEVCTMQVVTIEVEQAIEADSSVTDLDVVLLAPDGTVAATGQTRIDDD